MIEQRLRRLRRPASVPGLRQTVVSRNFGFDRGTPIDRHFIERFLDAHRVDIRGRVLEIKDDGYTRRFGSGVARSDVLDVDASNPRATVVADLADAGDVASGSFDCFLLTQTLQLIRDPGAALRHAHRILAPGGVLLLTVPSASPVVSEHGLVDYWRFTQASCTALLAEHFGPDGVVVETFGSLLTTCAFLIGIAAEELRREELELHDPRFPLLVAAAATRGASG